MRVYTDHERVKGKQRTGLGMSFLGLLIMAGSVAIIFREVDNSLGLLVGVVGLAVASTGTYFINRWVRPPLPEDLLPELLRRFDARHILFNHISTLPVPHLLLTPKGLIAIRAKRYEGPVRYDAEKERWRGNFSLARLYIRGLTAERLGNPTQELAEQQAAVETWLGETVPELATQVPVDAIALFLAPKSELDLTNAPIPLAQPDSVKKILRDQFRDQPTLPKATYQQLRDALESAVGNLEGDD